MSVESRFFTKFKPKSFVAATLLAVTLYFYLGKDIPEQTNVNLETAPSVQVEHLEDNPFNSVEKLLFISAVYLVTIKLQFKNNKKAKPTTELVNKTA